MPLSLCVRLFETERLIMGTLREIAKKIPVIPFVYRALRNRYARYQLKSKSTEDVFTEIYRSNAWGGKDSVSGTENWQLKIGN